VSIGLPGAVFLVLLILKLLGKLAISWLWVTAPLWGGTAIFGAFSLFCLVMAVITGQVTRNRR